MCVYVCACKGDSVCKYVREGGVGECVCVRERERVSESVCERGECV